MPDLDQISHPVDLLASRTMSDWHNLTKARVHSKKLLDDLKAKLVGLDNLDCSIVVFGSLARGEATHGSDLDWTLLIDGKADPRHLDMAQKISRMLPADKKPGAEETFGNLAFSHEILHRIGGENDSNANTTRRILLLLESRPIGNSAAWEDVQKNVLRRYIDEDYGLRSPSNKRGVPLFLLNDIARYWRTMVVDFAYKQRKHQNRGYALRSIKLGLSRKLIYASGLLACFMCDLNYPEKTLFKEEHPQRAIDYLRELFRMSPLETVATCLNQHESLLAPSKRLFDAYDSFVGLMGDDSARSGSASWRKHIEGLSLQQMETDPVFQEARKIRHDFGEALKDIFLKTASPIRDLMIERGVF